MPRGPHALRRYAVAAALLVASAAGAEDLVVRNARLVDGTGGPPRSGISILVRDGYLTAIGPSVDAAPDATVLDATGATVLPGLVDAHVHLKAGPGSALRNPSAAERLELLGWHLRAYLAFGVTTVLDPGATPAVVRRVRALLESGVPGPRYLTLGPFLKPPGGYPDDAATARTVATAEDAAEALARARRLPVYVHATIARMAPWLPGFGQRALARWVFRESAQRDALRATQRTLRRLHDAGVPIVLGSDTPYQSWAVYAFHGPTTLREVELLEESGLSRMQAIEAATRVPAEMLGLADEIGTVQVGKRADLVVVRGDPLADLGALRDVAWTVKDGVARSPQEWMKAR